MTKLLTGLVKDKDNNARSAYARLSAAVGILCNLMLCAVKFTVGAVTGSVSVTADAVNNLSDSAANIVTLTGTRLSDKPDDKEHPFGHGRIEYVSALIVAVSIFVVSFELGKSAVTKIIHPAPPQFSAVSVILLCATIGVKLWMAYFNRHLYHLTDNLNLKAVMLDSLNDCVATAGTVLSLILSNTLGLRRIDGVIGLLVSLFILYTGIDILRQVISPLLGEAPPQDITARIESIITESDIVLGVHDLVIHNYGRGKMLASADAEVDAAAGIFAIHKVIDAAEKAIQSELGITICIHMDPVDKSDGESEKYKLITEGVLREYNGAYTFHDFSITADGDTRILRFDLQIPYEETADNKKIETDLRAHFQRLCPEVTLDINIEHPYV